MNDDDALSLAVLDLPQLALFVGQRMNDRVLERLHARGFVGLRIAHGYVVQHVVLRARSITEIASRMGVSQQAASKAVAELVALGYLALTAADDDARKRLVQLSPRGKEAIRASRRIRRDLERRLLEGQSKQAVAHARAVLRQALTRLGGRDEVRARRVPEPR